MVQDAGSPAPAPDDDSAPAAPGALLARVRVVLVETSHPGNIGAAARAMKTMGLGKRQAAPRRRERRG